MSKVHLHFFQESCWRGFSSKLLLFFSPCEIYRFLFRTIHQVSAVCDNLAAAIGCAAKYPTVANGLVVVLGTAPAVSTFNRKGANCLETGIWQSWVWFTKIELKDKYGYAGGVKITNNGKNIVPNPPDFCKMPHKQVGKYARQHDIVQNKFVPEDDKEKNMLRIAV